MLYTIDLQGMEFHAFHGCYDLEQRVGNRFEVTLSITTEPVSYTHLDVYKRQVDASGPATTLEIEVTDSFGKVYRETMTRPKAFGPQMK